MGLMPAPIEEVQVDPLDRDGLGPATAHEQTQEKITLEVFRLPVKHLQQGRHLLRLDKAPTRPFLIPLDTDCRIVAVEEAPVSGLIEHRAQSGERFIGHAGRRAADRMKPFLDMERRQLLKRRPYQGAEVVPNRAAHLLRKGELSHVVAFVEDEQFPDGHVSPSLLFRLGEELFQPIQADRLLADLRHEPEAAPADHTAFHDRRPAMSVGRLAELLHVHGVLPGC